MMSPLITITAVFSSQIRQEINVTNGVHPPRLLDPDFEQSLASGMLQSLLRLVKQDRDLIAEIRTNRLDVYCKGNRLIGLEPSGHGSYRIWSDEEKFWPAKSLMVRERSEVDNFCRDTVPMIKQRIAEHSSTGREVEFEQMLIRSANLEALNTDYIAIDRQGIVEDGEGRTDVVGVYWPGGSRGYSKELAPALIEVKYGLTGNVGGIAAQVGRYYNDLKKNLEVFVDGLQGQLRQKARLGLLSGLSVAAQDKIRRLPISRSIDNLRVVIALVDYNPRAQPLDTAALCRLPFASQIDVFNLGFGMWKKNSVFQHPDRGT